jgi:hypothetical protein
VSQTSGSKRLSHIRKGDLKVDVVGSNRQMTFGAVSKGLTLTALQPYGSRDRVRQRDGFVEHAPRRNAKGPNLSAVFEGLAEREGFEPPIGLHLCRISSAVHSTTLPPLQAPLRVV